MRCIAAAKENPQCGDCIALHEGGGDGQCDCARKGAGCNTRPGAHYDSVYRMQGNAKAPAMAPTPAMAPATVTKAGEDAEQLAKLETTVGKDETSAVGALMPLWLTIGAGVLAAAHLL